MILPPYFCGTRLHLSRTCVDTPFLKGSFVWCDHGEEGFVFSLSRRKLKGEGGSRG